MKTGHAVCGMRYEVNEDFAASREPRTASRSKKSLSLSSKIDQKR